MKSNKFVITLLLPFILIACGGGGGGGSPALETPTIEAPETSEPETSEPETSEPETPGKTTAVRSGGWGQESTWSNGIPGESKRVIVPQGITVTLWGANRKANGVVVQGVLKIGENENANFSLETDWVHVNSGGKFEIGTQTNPYDQGQFTLTLTGVDPMADWEVETAMGVVSIENNNGFLMAAGGGGLEFYGKRKLSFTRLAESALVSASSISVKNIIERNYDGTTSFNSDGRLDWEVGDHIVIASSSADYRHEEVRTIETIRNLGDGTSEISFNLPLNHFHYGEIETYGTGSNQRSIDMRAEVALLSRNVKIQGLASQDTDHTFGDRALIEAGMSQGVGGHIMVMGSASTVVLDNVQLHGMGQTGRLGRYPIHWHVAGDRTGDQLRGVAITNSNNRGVTIHGTHNLLIQDVVLHDIHGHGFFMEDAVETGNQFVSNITFGFHKVGGDSADDILDPFLVDTHDHVGQNPVRFLSSAGFWMTNPDNTWVGNVSAGSEGTGYWFLFPKKPIGLAAADSKYQGVKPDRTNFGEFRDNASHSSPIGLNFDRGSDIEVPVGSRLKDNFNGDLYRPNVEPLVNGYTAYKHTTGVYHRARTGHFDQLRLADNFASTFITFTQRISNSLYVGYSRGNADKSEPVTGHTFYDGANTLDGTHFAGFTDAKAFTYRTQPIAIRHTHFVMRNTSFEDDGSEAKFSISDPNGKLRAYNPIGKTMPSVIYDEDGTLTGNVGGGAGSTVIGDHPFLYDANDFKPQGWRNARVSDDLYAVFRFRATQDPVFSITTPDGDTAEGRPGTSQFAGANALMKMDAGDYSLALRDGLASASRGFDILYFAVNGPRTGATVVKFTDMASAFSVSNRPSVSNLSALRNASETVWTNSGGHIYIKFFSVEKETQRVEFSPR